MVGKKATVIAKTKFPTKIQFLAPLTPKKAVSKQNLSLMTTTEIRKRLVNCNEKAPERGLLNHILTREPIRYMLFFFIYTGHHTDNYMIKIRALIW